MSDSCRNLEATHNYICQSDLVEITQLFSSVRSSQTLEYLGSIDDEDTERMVCLAVQTKGQDLTSVFSGGMELKNWQIVQDNKSRYYNGLFR